MVVTGYPPAAHYLSDLGMEAEVGSDTTARVRIRVTPHITTADGGVRAGVLATLVDVVGGSAALRALRPDWLATADLTLQLVRPATGPYVEARGMVVRKGRTILVVEAPVFNVEADGSDVLGDDGVAAPVAWATMTFAILPNRDTGPVVEVAEDLPVRWAFTGPGLDRPVEDELSIDVVDVAAGQVSMPVRAYLFNSFGAVQGGVMALLADVAGGAALAAAAGSDPDDMVVTDLQIAYLSLGRVGPIVSRSRVLGAGGGGTGGRAVIELIDQGAEGRLTTVINVGAVPFDRAAVGADAGAAPDV